MFPFTLQQLRILKAIATEKNLTKAADVLYLSQPTLSKQMKTLEKNLNVELIHRENNKVSFTENGRILLHYSERILLLCEECCRVFIDSQNGERGNLTIGTTPTIHRYLLPKILELFVRNYPQIDLKIQINSTRMISKSVQNREVDIGFVSEEIPKEFQKHVLVEPFVEDEIQLIVPKSHCFASQSVLLKEDLYGLNFITLHASSTFRRFIDQSLMQNQMDIHRFKIILEVHSLEGMKAAVGLGLGVAFIPYSAMEKEMALNVFQTLKIENMDITRPLAILNRPKSSKTEAVQLFSLELSKLRNNLETVP
jgi:DNA-binding transcriptional LysR family regulator